MRTHNVILRSAIYGALCIAGASGSALAQDKAVTLEEIVVTAQKRSENLQEVPIAISAFTSKTRDLIGITSIQDLTNFTPGLSYSTGTDRASLRGIGRQNNNLGIDAGVATYIDGFYNVSTTSAARSPLMVDRIEILRGPQGTLYGRNSIAGTINVISRRPTEDWYGEVRMTYANYDRHIVEGAVSGPINDWLRFRLAANNTDQQKGYYNNIIIDSQSEGGVTDSHEIEGQLEADFSANFHAWLKATIRGYTDHRRSAALVGNYDYGQVPAGYVAPAGAYGLTLAGSNYVQQGSNLTTNPTLNDIRDFATNTPSTQSIANSPNFVAQLTWNLPGMDLKYIGGYTRYKYVSTSDFDGTAVTSYTFPLATGSACSTTPGCGPVRYIPSSVQHYIEDKDYWSNEFNLSSSGNGSLQWLAGLYQYAEEYRQPVYYPNENSAVLTPVNGFGVGGLAPANPSGWIYYINSHIKTESYAAFGQVDWKVIDSVKLTLGARYSKDKKFGTEETRQICYGLSAAFGCAPLSQGNTVVAADVTGGFIASSNTPGLPGTTGVATRDPATGIYSRGLEAEWHATTGTAGIEWSPTEDTHLYGKYSRGYKSGGFNAGSFAGPPLTNPEYVNAFEVGLKTAIAQQVQINASVFRYDYQGMQIPISVVPLAGPLQTPFFNMDKVISQGLELETIWQATNQLQVIFDYAYLSAKISSTCTKTETAFCFSDTADPRALDPEANQAGPLNGTNQGQDVDGNQVPQSPKNKAALNINYRFDFASGSLTLSASDIWKDKTYFSIFNRSYNQAPSFSQVDARIIWNDSEDRFTIIGFVRNALDKLGYESYNGVLQSNVPQTIATSQGLTPPRTYGVEFQYRVGAKK